MTLYELVFILLFLGSVISLLLSAFLRRRGASKNILVALVSVWGVYLVILAVTDVLSSQRVFKFGEEQCFDEMCFAVVDVQTMPEQAFNPAGTTASRLYIVKIRVISHSRGVCKRKAVFAGVYMTATRTSTALRPHKRPTTLNMVKAQS